MPSFEISNFWSQIFSTSSELIQIIRYEDMSMEPIEQTSRIYDFIGMKISPEIEEFLKKSTTTQDLESNHRSDQKFMQIYTTSVSYHLVNLTVRSFFHPTF